MMTGRGEERATSIRYVSSSCVHCDEIEEKGNLCILTAMTDNHEFNVYRQTRRKNGCLTFPDLLHK